MTQNILHSQIYFCFSIERHCGDRFPERVVSSGQSLWMRFHSDETIQYSGFKAVYSFIPNPKPLVEDIGHCAFNVTGDEVIMQSRFFKKQNIFSILFNI